MVRKTIKPVMLAALFGSGLALGTIGSATAAYSQPAPTYPPEPPEKKFQFSQAQTQAQAASEQTSRQDQHSDIDVNVRDQHWDHEHHKRHHTHERLKELPMTGVPTETLAATSLGLLLAGAGMVIAARRRGTAGAK